MDEAKRKPFVWRCVCRLAEIEPTRSEAQQILTGITCLYLCLRSCKLQRAIIDIMATHEVIKEEKDDPDAKNKVFQ